MSRYELLSVESERVGQVDQMLADIGYKRAKNGGVFTPRDVLAGAVETARKSRRKVLLETHKGPNGRWWQFSVRPYRIGERCDGTRDDEAWLMLWRMSHDIEKLKAWNMPDAAFRIRQFADASGIHRSSSIPNFMRPIREWVDLTYDKKWPVRQVEELLADLYDMNYRSFAGGLAEVLGILRDHELAYTPGMIVEKYGNPHSVPALEIELSPEIAGLNLRPELATKLQKYCNNPTFEGWSELYSACISGRTIWQKCNRVFPGWLPTSIGANGWPFLPDPEKVLLAIK